MEQIKVNMIPNNEVKTIHCSKGDGNTRKWGFQLYKEDGVIDASSISPQMFFDSYKGGTEQILPENTSVPTTSPIIADIQYKDALRSEQEFLYRESPATVDGKAKITKIKGNTLVWNQLIKNGNFADSYVWIVGNWTIANGKISISIPSGGSDSTFLYNVSARTDYSVSGHKYYIKATLNSNYTTRVRPTGFTSDGSLLFDSTNSVDKVVGIFWTPSTSKVLRFDFDFFFGASGIAPTDVNCSVSNYQCFDLTALGIDNLATVAEVEAWLSSHIGNLPYYDYTTGKLLPFKGESLKTTGKNLYIGSPSFDGYTDRNQWTLSSETYNGHEVLTKVNAWVGTYKKLFLNVGTYTFSVMAKCSSEATCYIFSTNWESTASLNTSQKSFTVGTEWAKHSFTFDVLSAGYVCLRFEKGSGTTTLSISEYQLEFGSATSYEPYTSSTINLPVLDHFPTGMKSIVFSKNESIQDIVYPCNFNYYDELLSNKKKLLIGKYTFTGNETWTLSNNSYYSDIGLSSIAVLPEFGSRIAPILHDFLEPTSANALYFGNKTSGIALYSNGNVYISSATYANISSLTGTKLYYVLKTPTETSIQTASLVSENTEIPLYEDNDILVGECDELLSAESGFVPVKIKYQDDETIYSQKINLHVEKQI